jgi:hypothetical protein
VLGAVLAIGGCGGSDGGHTTVLPVGQCPTSDSKRVTVEIDWVDFVEFDGRMFMRAARDAAVGEARLGAELGTVACRLDGVVDDPGYAPRDGDASFLLAGTQLRQVTGFRSDLRIAAEGPDGWVLYDAIEVPGATTGADLLDLRDKVTRIELVESERGEGVVRTVDDPAVIARVVDALLAARVGSSSPPDDSDSRYFLRFTFTNGTTLERAWWVGAGIVDRGIAAPPELVAALHPPGS